MSLINRIESLVAQEPEWYTRLMNAIDCGLAEYLNLVNDIGVELGVSDASAIGRAVDHYQKRVEDEIWNDYKEWEKARK